MYRWDWKSGFTLRNWQGVWMRIDSNRKSVWWGVLLNATTIAFEFACVCQSFTLHLFALLSLCVCECAFWKKLYAEFLIISHIALPLTWFNSNCIVAIFTFACEALPRYTIFEYQQSIMHTLEWHIATSLEFPSSQQMNTVALTFACSSHNLRTLNSCTENIPFAEFILKRTEKKNIKMNGSLLSFYHCWQINRSILHSLARYVSDRSTHTHTHTNTHTHTYMHACIHAYIHVLYMRLLLANSTTEIKTFLMRMEFLLGTMRKRIKKQNKTWVRKERRSESERERNSPHKNNVYFGNSWNYVHIRSVVIERIGIVSTSSALKLRHHLSHTVSYRINNCRCYIR